MREDREFQVCISIDGPKGQLMQVSYSEYLNYWKGIGWRLENKAPLLPLMPAPVRTQCAQRELF